MGFVNASVNRMDQYFTKSVAKGKMTPEQKEEALNRFTKTDKLQDMEEADLIIEAVLENMELKKSVFQELNHICRKETVFASNTSSMSITEIGRESGRPDQFCGIHFFNPVPVMKLVEVIRGLNTSDETLEAALQFTLSLGKTPVEVKKDSPGFIVNRLLLPYLNEAAKMLSEGVATVEDIDTAVRLGLNYPMGPFQMIDFGGMQLTVDILNYLKEEFNDNQYAPQPLLRQMVRAGKLGPKAGEGFYKYE
jgi:3-hydroxybutyryl-CoA dehydrogenase